eukprot:13924449-Ditylum_brightwellii.AAC.1
MDLQEDEFETQTIIVFWWTSLSPQADHQRTGPPALMTVTLSSQPHQFCQDPAATSKKWPHTPPKNGHAPPPPPQNSHAPPLQEQLRNTTTTAIRV